MTLPEVASLIIAYLLGSIPFGFLIVKLTSGSDIRETGSGGTGATNVSRKAGKAAGVVTLALDALKGAAAVVDRAMVDGRSWNFVDHRRRGGAGGYRALFPRVVEIQGGQGSGDGDGSFSGDRAVGGSGGRGGFLCGRLANALCLARLDHRRRIHSIVGFPDAYRSRTDQ